MDFPTGSASTTPPLQHKQWRRSSCETSQSLPRYTGPHKTRNTGGGRPQCEKHPPVLCFDKLRERKRFDFYSGGSLTSVYEHLALMLYRGLTSLYEHVARRLYRAASHTSSFPSSPALAMMGRWLLIRMASTEFVCPARAPPRRHTCKKCNKRIGKIGRDVRNKG